MFSAMAALIRKTELPGDLVLEALRSTSRLLPTPATGSPAADEKKNQNQVKSSESDC